MRNLSCAVNVRRRGRSENSGDAAAGAETIVGLRPSSLSAPAAARVLLSLIWGITTGCLSYALKGKLPAGVCLIIIGTEGRLLVVFDKADDGTLGKIPARHLISDREQFSHGRRTLANSAKGPLHPFLDVCLSGCLTFAF